MSKPSSPLPKRVLVSGASGLLGSALVQALQARGDAVVPLVRGAQRPGAIVWDPQKDTLDPHLVSGFDAVVHLAGEPVAGLWTPRKKRRIFDSRVHGTKLLTAALAASARPPQTFLCASGINIYGDHGDEIVDETTPPGQGFLSKVCVAWEAACAPLQPVCRVVSMRIGVVLTPKGGALAAMLPLFRLGLGGTVAGGKQWVSWLTVGDLVGAVLYLLDSQLQGPVNVVSPQPVPARAFAHTLAATLHRRDRLSIPGWLLRAMLGQLATETVLSSVRAEPQRLLADGFAFAEESLGQALASLELDHS